jgi:hypothetical protein
VGAFYQAYVFYLVPRRLCGRSFEGPQGSLGNFSCVALRASSLVRFSMGHLGNPGWGVGHWGAGGPRAILQGIP